MSAVTPLHVAPRRWRRDPEKVKAAKRRYYQKHKERLKAKQAAWRAAHPDLNRERNRIAAQKRTKRNPEWQQHLARWRRYRMTPEQYHALIERQEGRCAICQQEPEAFHVDHSHVTGAVRGLLCFSCNTALGHLGDDPAVCERAATYLARAAKDITNACA